MSVEQATEPRTVRTAPAVPLPTFTNTSSPRWFLWFQNTLTTVIVVGPFLTLCFVMTRIAGQGVALRSLVLAVVLYFVIGHGVTAGFHRLFTHKSFVAKRPLKITLAVLGSMSFQGSIIGWVADHRRHHVFSDQPGDPHSPSQGGEPGTSRFAGLWHAHIGWFFTHQSTSREQYAPDLLADRDLVLIDRLFIPCCILTLAGPFAIGYLLSGSFAGGIATFVWAGVLRVGFFHQITWATNSVCHRFGKRPFRSSDESTNFAPLALLSLGESWHNAHHAFPASARHGVDRFQLDTSAWLIRAFERLGWASRVRWPDPARLDSRRVGLSAHPAGAGVNH
jgi:stearoyl-CoA desaturase (Delta-9 desaturase)